MASSTDLLKLDFTTKAAIIYQMLHSSCAGVKDLFKYALGGAAACQKLKWISEDAYSLWKHNWPKDVYANGVKYCHHKDSIIEHVVPIEVMYNWLLANKSKLTVKDVENAIRNCPVAIVTKDEDRRLNAAKLQKTMPHKDYDLINGNPFTRYDAIGLELHKWHC